MYLVQVYLVLSQKQLWNVSLEKRERKNLANYKSGIKTYLMHIKK
jgi:hypothetical protein